MKQNIFCVTIQLDVGIRFVFILFILHLLLLLIVLIVLLLEFFYIVLGPRVRGILECVVPDISFEFFEFFMSLLPREVGTFNNFVAPIGKNVWV